MRRNPSAILVIYILVSAAVPSAVAWDMERPSTHTTINMGAADGLEDSHTDGKATTGLGVNVVGYRENWGMYPSDGDDDIVDLRISTVANTREIIKYLVQTDSYAWHEPGELTHQLFLGDNDGQWIFEPGFVVRFYGGPNSGEYANVWVSSNGFVSFYTYTEPSPGPEPTDPYYPYAIANPAQPNAFIAPFWRDLKPDAQSSVKYGIVSHSPIGNPPYIECLAISWNNVPDKYGVRQSFQVLLENAQTVSGKLRQSRIWFQYQSITPLHDQTTVGIEDQRGGKGVSYDYHMLENGMALRFQQNSNSALISQLTIRLSENETSAHTIVITESNSTRGTNIVLAQDVEDLGATYALALEGAAALILYGVDLSAEGVLVATGGFLIGVLFVIEDYAEEAAIRQKEAKLFDSDNCTATAHAIADPDGLYVSSAVDASLDISIYWVLHDSNTEDHTLTISSELTYYEYDYYGNYVANSTIDPPPSVTLEMSPETDPRETSLPINIRGWVATYDLQDSYWYLLTGTNVTHKIEATPLNSSVDLLLELYSYDPSTGAKTLLASSDSGVAGENESITEGPLASVNAYRLVTVKYWLGSYCDDKGWYDLLIYAESPEDDGGTGGGGGCWPPPRMIAL